MCLRNSKSVNIENMYGFKVFKIVTARKSYKPIYAQVRKSYKIGVWYRSDDTYDGFHFFVSKCNAEYYKELLLLYCLEIKHVQCKKIRFKGKEYGKEAYCSQYMKILPK